MAGTVYDDYIPSLVDSMMNRLGNGQNNLLFIKHYNTFDLEDVYVRALSMSRPEAEFLFHDFDITDMLAAYEPFVDWINQLYHEYGEKSLDEFFDANEVYSLHRPVFRSYFENGRCKREEGVLIGEIEFEQKRFVDEIVRMLQYFSRKKPLLMILNRLHAAGSSTIELISRLMADPESGRIGLIATCNEAAPELEYNKGIWQSFQTYLNEHDCVIDWTLDSMILHTDINPGFDFSVRKLEEYDTKLNNMLYFLALDQAEYYLDILYHKFEVEKVYISPDYKFRFFYLYAKTVLYREKYSEALLYCEGLKNILDVIPQTEWEYYYNLLKAEIQMYNFKTEKAMTYVKRCEPLCEELKDDYLKFKMDMLAYMIRFQGWRNIWSLIEDDSIDPTLLERAEKYEYYNHLAHIYVYSFDNDVEKFSRVENIDERIPTFYKGIALAQKLGNEQFLIEAYKKNIMIASNSGNFDVTDRFYEKYYEVIKDSNNLAEKARIGNGRGYNCCTVGKYEEANRFYNRSLAIFAQLQDMESISETLYNMAVNAFLAESYAVADSYLAVCLRIVSYTKSNSVPVCNISKIFGLRAYCSYELGTIYNTKLHAQKMEQYLGHIIAWEEEGKSEIHLWDDDMFLYYAINGMLLEYEGRLKDAVSYMEKSKKHLERSKGSEFLNRPIYAIAYARICRRLDMPERAEYFLNDAIRFCEKKGYEYKKARLVAELEGKTWVKKEFDLPLEGITLESITEMAYHQGMNLRFEQQQEEIDFLGIWQKFMNNQDDTMQHVIDDALVALKSNFSLDALTFVRLEEGTPVVYFDDSPYGMDQEKVEFMIRYFTQNRREFALTRLDKGYAEQKELIQHLFGVSAVNTIIGVPIFVNEQLNSIFLATIDLGTDWNYKAKKYEFDSEELAILRLLFRQLLESMERTEAREQIKNINNELQFVNNRLKDLAVKDTLTGLYNRQGFNEELEIQMNRAKKGNRDMEVSFLYADLDNFKYYNDTFGHDTGDFLLKQYAKLIQGICEARGYAVRYGGDEFILVLYTNDHDEIEEAAKSIYTALDHEKGFAERIAENLGKPVEIPREKYLSCSIGISTTVLSVEDMTKEKIEATLKKADEMMYYVKKTTKHRYVFYEE
ncbi:MAG: diguanylate cyclase [Roseburia sp.]